MGRAETRLLWHVSPVEHETHAALCQRVCLSVECRRCPARHDGSHGVVVEGDGREAAQVSGIDGAALVGQSGIIQVGVQG